ncbi:Methyltransferase domain-containing protein [Halobacillus dabanensis]|uniref:Methyltransferase domain-containing protein n=1 Tax=Halobacillus dabanensis TaxID=240302 RepID=A0A1I3SST5_HALDA|nr:class I SAM-dependent methyltransferase [Halobacillus dabanensis]SFJ61838.1 Methyltransferase domain-containing protein [Halobacillus dabanensis]
MISQELKQKLSEAYDQESINRNKGETQKWKVIERQSFLQTLAQEQKNSLLEIGAGPGKDSLFFARQGMNVQATDLSEEMVKRCQEKGLKAHVMSFDDLMFPAESFHAIWALNCLLHVPKKDLPHILTEIKRTLKPDGLFYMGVYGGIDQEGVWEEDFHEPKRFFSFFKDADLEKLLQNYFRVERFNKIPMPRNDSGPIHFQGVILRN